MSLLAFCLSASVAPLSTKLSILKCLGALECTTRQRVAAWMVKMCGELRFTVMSSTNLKLIVYNKQIHQNREVGVLTWIGLKKTFKKNIKYRRVCFTCSITQSTGSSVY